MSTARSSQHPSRQPVKFDRRGIPSIAIIEPAGSALLKEFECAICSELCFEPQITQCHHVFCKQCLSDSRASGNSLCPIDRKPASVHLLTELRNSSAMLFRVYDAIKLRCPFAHAHQCDWTGSPSTLHEHIIVCETKSETFAPNAHQSTCDGSCHHAALLRAQLDTMRSKLTRTEQSRDDLQYELGQVREMYEDLYQECNPPSLMMPFHDLGEEGVHMLIRYFGSQCSKPPPSDRRELNHLFNCVINIGKRFESYEYASTPFTLMALAANAGWFSDAQILKIYALRTKIGAAMDPPCEQCKVFHDDDHCGY